MTSTNQRATDMTNPTNAVPVYDCPRCSWCGGLGWIADFSRTYEVTYLVTRVFPDELVRCPECHGRGYVQDKQEDDNEQTSTVASIGSPSSSPSTS